MPAFHATLFALICCLITGCTTTITSPPNPSDPVTVWLLDHGRHPSLILPLADGRFIRYAYGDWKWYALNETGFFQAIDAMCLPSIGALGRKFLSGDADMQTLRRHDPTEHEYPITISRAQAQSLANQLDNLFQSQISTRQFNPIYDLDFVHHSESYALFHNCNHVMADWLKTLGCQVRGPAMFSTWRIEPPAP